jgi:hypothetical protein
LQRSAPRLDRRTAALAAIAIVSGIVGLTSFWRERQPRFSPPRMCAGLPDYESLQQRIPRNAAVLFEPRPGIGRLGERFFCLRFALAPRLVSRPAWPRVTARISRRAWRVVDSGSELRLVPPRPAARTKPG